MPPFKDNPYMYEVGEACLPLPSLPQMPLPMQDTAAVLPWDCHQAGLDEGSCMGPLGAQTLQIVDSLGWVTLGLMTLQFLSRGACFAHQ